MMFMLVFVHLCMFSYEDDLSGQHFKVKTAFQVYMWCTLHIHVPYIAGNFCRVKTSAKFFRLPRKFFHEFTC